MDGVDPPRQNIVTPALIVLMIFRPQGLLGARQRLLANGRTAYLKLVGRPEQISSDSALVGEKGDEV